MANPLENPESHTTPHSPDPGTSVPPATNHPVGPAESTSAPANVIPFPPPAPAAADPAANPSQPRTRADIARENGAKSKGPTSPDGKRRSSRNAITHGFTAKHCGYSNQIHTEVDKYHRQFSREYRPQTPTEMAFIDTMALCRWQQQSAAEELAAFVNHTRETFFNDPAHSEALRNMLAVDKLTRENRSYENHQRHLRDAERRMARAVREIIFLRKNNHLLEIDDAIRPNFDDTRMNAPSMDDVEPFHADSTPALEATVPVQNEPIQPAENTHSTADNEPAHSSPYPEPTPTQAAAKAVPKKYQGVNLEEWHILKIINKSLLKYPAAFREVADALCDYERKQIAMNP